MTVDLNTKKGVPAGTPFPNNRRYRSRQAIRLPISSRFAQTCPELQLPCGKNLARISICPASDRPADRKSTKRSRHPQSAAYKCTG
jgi:hypothetical protein